MANGPLAASGQFLVATDNGPPLHSPRCEEGLQRAPHGEIFNLQARRHAGLIAGQFRGRSLRIR